MPGTTEMEGRAEHHVVMPTESQNTAGVLKFPLLEKRSFKVARSPRRPPGNLLFCLLVSEVLGRGKRKKLD